MGLHLFVSFCGSFRFSNLPPVVIAVSSPRDCGLNVQMPMLQDNGIAVDIVNMDHFTPVGVPFCTTII
jgi:hypothetical protein